MLLVGTLRGQGMTSLCSIAVLLTHQVGEHEQILVRQNLKLKLLFIGRHGKGLQEGYGWSQIAPAANLPVTFTSICHEAVPHLPALPPLTALRHTSAGYRPKPHPLRGRKYR